VAAALFLVSATVCASQVRIRKVQEMTLEGLNRSLTGLQNVRAASANRRQALAAIQSQFGHGGQHISAELVLYSKVDEIKTRLNPNDMTISAVEKKDGEVSIQYTLKLTGQDFNTLLNSISYLHGSVFPLAPVSSVIIARSDAKGTGGVSSMVTGKIITSEIKKP
jgi:hypothetical protein